MCPWVGSNPYSLGRLLLALPSRVGYLSPQGVLLPLVYATTASPLWLELRGRTALQATPSWTVYRLACHRLLPWLRVTFAMAPDAARLGTDQWPTGTAAAAGPMGRQGRPGAPDPWAAVACFASLGRPRCARVCGVLGHFAPVHRCARLVRCAVCVVSWATLLLFIGGPALCIVLRVGCPGPLGSCSLVSPLGAFCCVCGLLGHLADVHRCFVLCVQCPRQFGSCAPVCPLGALCCLCGVLGHLAPLHRCALLLCCSVCAVSRATWLLYTCVQDRSVVLHVRCPQPRNKKHRTGTPLNRSQVAQDTAHITQCTEQAQRRTRGKWPRTTHTQHKHRAGRSMDRSKVAEDTAHAAQHTERAHRSPAANWHRTLQPHQNAQSEHIGEQEPSGPGHHTRSRTHHTGTAVFGSNYLLCIATPHIKASTST